MNALISRQARLMGSGRSCEAVGDDLNTAHLDILGGVVG